MLGDRHKPEARFSRWVNSFMDGIKELTRKGKRKIPSFVSTKRFQRRWRRRNQHVYIEEQHEGREGAR